MFSAEELGSSKLSTTLPTAPTELSQFPKLCELRRKFPVLYRVEFQVRPGKSHFPSTHLTLITFWERPNSTFRSELTTFTTTLRLDTLSIIDNVHRKSAINNNLLHFTISRLCSILGEHIIIFKKNEFL